MTSLTSKNQQWLPPGQKALGFRIRDVIAFYYQKEAYELIVGVTTHVRYWSAWEEIGHAYWINVISLPEVGVTPHLSD